MSRIDDERENEEFALSILFGTIAGIIMFILMLVIAVIIKYVS